MSATTYASAMASYVLVYDRKSARTLRLLAFDAEHTSDALRAWQELEHAHLAEPDTEVVLLDAESEEDLRRTHGRYFDLSEEIAKRQR